MWLDIKFPSPRFVFTQVSPFGICGKQSNKKYILIRPVWFSTQGHHSGNTSLYMPPPLSLRQARRPAYKCCHQPLLRSGYQVRISARRSTILTVHFSFGAIHPENDGIVPQIKSLSLPSTFFPINFSLITSPLETIN
jgi:hypothetical protein